MRFKLIVKKGVQGLVIVLFILMLSFSECSSPFSEQQETCNLLEDELSILKEQIELIEILEKKGYTYQTSDGIYFDTSKFPDYGKMALLNIEGLEEGKRIDY